MARRSRTAAAGLRLWAGGLGPGPHGAGAAVNEPRGAEQPLHLRLRRPTSDLLALPWAMPLADWPEEAATFRRLPVGPSRHLVRFVTIGDATVALKEEPSSVANREYEALRQMESLALPAVHVIGIAERPSEDVAIIATDYLRHSLQYRRLLARVPLVTGGYRDRLLDAMASLLVDLHRAGRLLGRLLAGQHAPASRRRSAAGLPGRRRDERDPPSAVGRSTVADLDVLVENVAFGLADLAAMQAASSGGTTAAGVAPDAVPDSVEDATASMDEQLAAAEAVRDRYEGLWEELFRVETIAAGDAFAIEARVRRLNELGFDVEEIELEPEGQSEVEALGWQDVGIAAGQGSARLRVVVSERDFHTRELRRLARINALEGQARLLLNDMREYRSLAGRLLRPAGLAARRARRAGEPSAWIHRSPAWRRPSVPGVTRSRPTATCSSTSGCSPSRLAGTLGWRRPLPRTWTVGAPAPETAEPIAEPEAEPS